MKQNNAVTLDSSPAAVLAALKHGQRLTLGDWTLSYGPLDTGEAVILTCPGGDEEDFPASAEGVRAAILCLRDDLALDGAGETPVPEVA